MVSSINRKNTLASSSPSTITTPATPPIDRKRNVLLSAESFNAESTMSMDPYKARIVGVEKRSVKTKVQQVSLFSIFV
jgi:hypothetical protein